MSTAITLTFLPTKDRALLNHQITATMRTKLTLKRGDTFYAGQTGLLCRITSVSKLSVAQALTHYRELGFASHEEAFIQWQQLHPFIGKRLHYKVFFYRFEVVQEVQHDVSS